MNCPNCGADVTGKSFCSQCGTPVQAQPEQTYQQPYQQPQQQYYTPQPAPYNAVQPQQQLGNPTPILVFGILGLALSELGIVGLIFSIIGLVRANNYINTYGTVSTQVNVGRRLAIAGLIVSIIFIVFWICYFILIGFVVSNASNYYSNYSSYYGY